MAAAEILPSLLAGPFAGALADRLDPRKAMITCDLARAALVLSLLLAPASLLIPCVYAVGFLVSLVGLLFDPAKNVAVLLVAGPGQVGRALALSRATESAALAAAFASGFGGSLVAVAVGMVLMLRSPPEALGRITALFEAAGRLSSLAALAFLGVLPGSPRPSYVLLACGLLTLAALLGTAAARSR